jgi:hypothetical protein
MSFSIVVPNVTQVACVVLGACPFIPPPPCELDGAPEARGIHLGDLAEDRMGLVPLKMRFLLRGAPSWSFV